jgi:aromatase
VKSEIGIDVAAEPRLIFELAREVERWPQLLPHYRKVTIESRDGSIVRARMNATRSFGRLGVPVSWTAEQWADDSNADDLRLHFRHLRGVTRGMEVTWHIRPTNRNGAGTTSRVTIEHVFSRHLPLLGTELLPKVVDRFFVRPIAGRTLQTFKELAERDK